MNSQTIQKYSKQTVPNLIKIAERHFNKFIRNRDSKDGYFYCISCGKPKSIGKMHAGHFFSAGHNPSVRFNEDNVHGQCLQCNFYLHGNLAKYQDNIIKKLGKEKFEQLRLIVGREKNLGFKWDRFSLIDVIEKYKELNKKS